MRPLVTGIGGTIAEDRLALFVEWVMSGVVSRAWALRLSVISLAVGVLLLPLPFLDLSGDEAVGILVVGVAVVTIWAIGEAVYAHKLRKNKEMAGLVIG